MSEDGSTTMDDGSTTTDDGAQPAVCDLARRTGLAVDPAAVGLPAFRAAGLPLLLAAVVASGHAGWSTYTVRDGDTLSAIAAAHRTDVATLATANRLAARHLLRPGQRLSVPADPARATPPGPGRTPGAATYRVRAGDTVYDIARRARLDPAAVLAANDLTSRSVIQPGQLLLLPGLRPAPVRATPGAARRATPPAAKARPVVHLVRPGDTVSAVAARYHVSVRAVLAANHLDARALIRPGRKLVLPGVTAASSLTRSSGAPARPKPPAPIVHRYTVRSGDTLSSIAAASHTTVARLTELNSISRAATIRVGQQLTVPGTVPASVPNTFLGRTYPREVAAAAAVNRAVLATRPVPGRDQIRAMITSTARSMGVPPELALAVSYQESGFNARVVSPANAIGAMQVIPSSGRWAGQLVGRELNLLLPRDNVTAGVAIIKALLEQAGDQPTAIAGYYQGLGSVRSGGMLPDTRRYVANVQTLAARFR